MREAESAMGSDTFRMPNEVRPHGVLGWHAVPTLPRYSAVPTRYRRGELRWSERCVRWKDAGCHPISTRGDGVRPHHRGADCHSPPPDAWATFDYPRCLHRPDLASEGATPVEALAGESRTEVARVARGEREQSSRGDKLTSGQGGRNLKRCKSAYGRCEGAKVDDKNRQAAKGDRGPES